MATAQSRSSRQGLLLLILFLAFVLTVVQWRGLERLRQMNLSGMEISPLQVSLLNSIVSGERLLTENAMLLAIPEATDCSSDLSSYFKLTKLEAKIKENVEFHQLGGNLKSVQNFLDKAIDPIESDSLLIGLHGKLLVHNAAMSSQDGTTLFPNTVVGTENQGLSFCEKSPEQCAPVTLNKLDSYVEK